MSVNTPYLTRSQIPDKAMEDHFNRQAYLGNAFAYTLANTSAGTSEVPLILLTNSSTTGKSVFQDLRRITCVTASQSVIVRVYLNPTVTGAGTPAVAVNLRPAIGTASILTLASAPSVSANGSLIDVIGAAAFTSQTSALLSVIDLAQIMLITAQASASSVTTDIQLGWYEV